MFPQWEHDSSTSAASACWKPKHEGQRSWPSDEARKRPHPETHEREAIFKKTPVARGALLDLLFQKFSLKALKRPGEVAAWSQILRSCGTPSADLALDSNLRWRAVTPTPLSFCRHSGDSRKGSAPKRKAFVHLHVFSFHAGCAWRNTPCWSHYHLFQQQPTCLSSFHETSWRNSLLWELLPSNLSWSPIGSRQSNWLANCREACKYAELDRQYKCRAHDNYIRIFSFTTDSCKMTSYCRICAGRSKTRRIATTTALSAWALPTRSRRWRSLTAHSVRICHCACWGLAGMWPVASSGLGQFGAKPLFPMVASIPSYLLRQLSHPPPSRHPRPAH